MRTVKNKLFISIISLLCVGALCLSLSSCTIRLGSYSLGNDSDQSLEDWLNGGASKSGDTDGTTSSQGEGKPASVITDVPDQSGSGATITVEGGSDGSVEYAVAKGLTSAVSVVANFKSSGTWGSSSSSGASAGSGVIIKIDKELGNALIMTN